MAGPPGRIVSIHIELNNQEEQCKIDFPFNTAVDNIDAVLADLGQSVPMTPADAAVARKMIADQLAVALGDPDHDPGWLQLLEHQRVELQELETKHLREQQDILGRLTGRQVREDLLMLF
jgi:hypothetical protein